MAAINEKSIELTHGAAKLVVDARTGSVLRLEDTRTGVARIDAKKDGRNDGCLFRTMVPAENWWSRVADSSHQKRVRVSQRGGGATVEFPALVAADGAETGVSARVDIRPGGPDEFVFVLHLENSGSSTVLDTAFPVLGGWHERGTGRIALGANSFVDPGCVARGAGNNYARNGRRWAWQYPVSIACPWVDFPGSGGGLSYINYMAEARNGRFWIENMDGYGDDFRLALGWIHLIALPPGQSWTSPPVGVSVHNGDWRATADRYAAWFDTRHAPDYSRPAIRSRIGFQNVFFRGFDGTPIRKLDRIPHVAAVGRKFGVDMLCVWDTLTLGNYARHNPRDLTDYPPDERQLIARGLQRAEREGTSTCALINFRHPNVGLHLPDKRLLDRVQKRYTGTPRTENWAANHTMGDLWSHHIGPQSYVFSPFSRFQRDRVIRISRDYLALGYTSMFYDQPFEYDPDYGFAGRGKQPDMAHHEALTLVGKVRRLLLAGNPNAVIIGEESDILATPVIDQWMSWSISEPSPALIERMELMRFSIPHTILSWVVDHEPERASLAFAFGMQLCLMVHGGDATLEDEPAFGSHVHALANLRKATAERTVMARFRGTRGVEVEGGEGFVAYAYDSPAGPAIIAAAAGKKAKGKVKVDRDAFAAPGKPRGGALFRLDGSTVACSGSTRDFVLGANEVAVWVL